VSRRLRANIVLLSAAWCLILGLLLVPGALSAEEPTPAFSLLQKRPLPFLPGEKLTYEISWSNIVNAGVAVMEVTEVKTPDRGTVLELITTARSVGMVDAVYPVNDIVRSLFDPRSLQSLAFNLSESHGKRKRQRDTVFDHEARTAISRVNNGPSEVLTIPENVQDALSAMYYLRTRDAFSIGKPIIIQVVDSGKTWSVEVHVLGRETVKTPAGEFATIKVKTFPKYEGVFMNKGEIFIWLTDDSRKLPVLMKSTITIGSIVSTLTEVRTGPAAH